MEIHPKDAERLQIKNKERVRLLSNVGSIKTRIKIVEPEDILPGVLQLTHGWDEANVNLLTDDMEVDPISGLPNMKIVMVRVEKLLPEEPTEVEK